MGLRAKTFVVMLLVGAGIAGLALFVQQQTVRSSFGEYLIASRQMQAEQLAEELLQNFSERGSWTSVLRQGWRWPEMYRPLRRQPPPMRAAPERRLAGQRPPHPPPRDRRPPPPVHPESEPPANDDGRRQPMQISDNVRHFTLYDAERTPLTESDDANTERQWLALNSGGKRVGWLGWVTPAMAHHPLDNKFWAEQRRNMLTISSVAFLLAALAAWVFSGLMLGRIRLLSQAVSGVAQGNHAWELTDRSSDELGQLARDINAMSDALQQSREREQQWLADIAHELRTPLAVLRGELEALQDGVRQNSPAAIRSLQDEVTHLNRLIDDLHLLSISESGQLSLNRQNVDLVELLQTVASSHQSALLQRQLPLTLAVPESLPAYIDEHRLRQVLDNLIVNVQRYATPGDVELRAEAAGNSVVLTLSDAGPGVSASERERLFNRLYRTDSARDRAHGGSGLGLAICRGIVLAHGGTIQALPSTAGGLSIRITLPLHGTSQGIQA